MRPVLLLVLGGILAGGCPSSSGTGPDSGALPDGDAAAPLPDGAPGSDGSTPADSGTPVDAGGGGGCGQPVTSGDHTWTLTHGGRQRTFHVHVPTGYDPSTPTPVVLDFHGRNSTAGQQSLLSELRALADAEGFLAVNPEGVGLTWNAGVCCGQAMDEGVDDVGFTAAMLDRLEAELCVDTHRVYATGISNGGFMAYRLGCELAQRIAALSSVAGPTALLGCAPSRAVPVFHFHGTADTIVPYDGFMGQLAVDATLAAWVANNGCASVPTTFFQQAEVQCEEWTGCTDNATVRLCTIAGGGHQWPGGFTIPGLGYNTSVISATQMSWDFFADHALP